MGRPGEFIFPHIRLAAISQLGLIIHILNEHWPAPQPLRVKPPAVKKMGKKWVEGIQNLQKTCSRCMQIYGILNSIFVCLFCYYEFDFSRAGKYCAKSWIRAHKDIQKKSSKWNACNVEDTQWFRCELKLGHFFRGVFVFSPQNQSLTFPARTTRRAEINHVYRGEVE